MQRQLIRFFAVGVMALSGGVACADIGDEILSLFAEDGASDDQFGTSIAIDNGLVAIGAVLDDDQGVDCGAAYIFDASTGDQIVKLLPSDSTAGNWFGWSIAINNGVVAVGARFDDDNGPNSGSAYLFDAFTGDLLAKLLPDDGTSFELFGFSVAIDNGIVAVGALRDDDNGVNSGSAYLFDSITGDQLFKLFASDAAVGDWFGNAIAIDNGIVAVGAFHDDDNGFRSGSVYLFDASTGDQIAKLVPSDGAAGDEFGVSVAIDNGIVAVGARWDDDNGEASGSAYLFDVSTGGQLAKLLPKDGSAADQFGFSIAIDNGIVAVGALFDAKNGSNSGSAYLFYASTGTQIAKLLPSGGSEGDRFGNSIAIENGIVAIGAIQDDGKASDSGSAYLFDASVHTTHTGFAIETGVLLEGEISDIESSDDLHIHTRSGFGTNPLDLHHMDMRVGINTTEQSPLSLDITIESHISEPAGIAQVRLLNQMTGRFVFIDQYVLFATDTIDTIPDIDATNYVSGAGDIELSFKHLVFVPFLAFTFESWVDHVEIVVR